MSRTGSLPQRHVADQLDRMADELSDRFRGVFSPNTVTRFVYETYALLDEHATPGPQVLFICVHNAGRSQMASALLDHHAAGKVSVRSAGSHPRCAIPDIITTAMGELGITLTETYPKPLTDEVVNAADVVVTMGCGDACPVYPGKRYLDWQIDDPLGKPLPEIRRIRDDIDGRVRSLLSELGDD